MKIVRQSIITGIFNEREIDISHDALMELSPIVPKNKRRPIQEIVPHLSADDREFLLSGITPKEWAAHMKSLS